MTIPAAPLALPGSPEKWARLRAYARACGDAVPGWLHPASVAAVWSLLEAQALAGVRGDVAEIGVYHGKLFILMALALEEGEFAWGVDPFELSGEEIEPAFRANLDRYGVAARARVRRAKSQEIAVADARDAFGDRVRMFSVDGWHDRACVMHDLALARATLAPDGVVLVDDFCSVWTPDVTLGVADFLRDSDGDLTPIGVISHTQALTWGGFKLLLARPAAAQLYTDAVQRGVGGVSRRPCEFMGRTLPLWEATTGAQKKSLLTPQA